jgi:Mg2+-importing ATPase
LAVAYRAGEASPVSAAPLGVVAAGALAVPGVLARLGSDRAGLTPAEAARRLRALGPNAVRSHRARAFPVPGRQLRSPLLILLAVTAVASFFAGERGDAVIIGVILLASVGPGFVSEYRPRRPPRRCTRTSVIAASSCAAGIRGQPT